MIAASDGSVNYPNHKGIMYSDDNGETWTQSDKTDGSFTDLCITSTGKVIACGDSDTGVWYSDTNPNPQVVARYTSTPVTKKQVEQYVQEFKTYVQSLKQ